MPGCSCAGGCELTQALAQGSAGRWSGEQVAQLLGVRGFVKLGVEDRKWTSAAWQDVWVGESARVYHSPNFQKHPCLVAPDLCGRGVGRSALSASIPNDRGPLGCASADPGPPALSVGLVLGHRMPGEAQLWDVGGVCAMPWLTPDT